MITDTIVAQCTPSGSGALALLRVSGKNSRNIVDQCAQLSSQKKITNVPSHTIHHGWIIDDNGKHLDEVMFFVMNGPRTFTGQNVVEVTTHNNPFIVESVIKRIIACGARLAQRGEFSRQAVESGKIDLIQAEAINELIHANSQQLLQQSLQQLKGSFSHWIAEIETQLLKLAALCEASFEFIEEDIDFTAPMKTSLQNILKYITQTKHSFDQQQQLRQGARIALIGSVNAGKSSLFNALIGKERAIVTNIAGTTRDVIEAGLYKNGVYWTLIDTAGLRQANNVVELEGIKRSHKEAKTADIILLVVDSSKTMSPQEINAYQEILSNYQKKIIIINNKSDLGKPKNPLFNKDCLPVSAKNNTGITKLKALLEKEIEKLFQENSSPFLLNKRHFSLLLGVEQKLLTTKAMLTDSVDYELIAIHLKDALEALSELSGKSVSEKTLDTVFNEFCIGK